jgi:hypothetical protein
MIGDLERDDDPKDARLAVEWREPDVLPYFELRLFRPRPIVVLDKSAKPKATGELSEWFVEVTSGPARMSPATGSPERLRADELEALIAAEPRLPLGLPS